MFSLFWMFSLVSLFWKNKSRLKWTPFCLCVCVSRLSTCECLSQSLWNLVCISWHPESISTAYFINPSHHSVSMCIPISLLGNGSVNTFPLQQIHDTKNCWTHPFLCGPCLIKIESLGLLVYLPIVARQWLGKGVPAATKNFWRHRFLYGPCRIKGKYAISSSQNFLIAYFPYFEEIKVDVYP
jgi:hypothetical protein